MTKTRLALSIAVAATAACSDTPETSSPRTERLEIIDEQPPFEGGEPFAEIAPTEWDDATILADDRTVEIQYLGGTTGCFGADHVRVAYEAERIVLTVHDGVIHLGSREACALVGITKTVTVRLSEPVAGRELVDGGEGQHGP